MDKCTLYYFIGVVVGFACGWWLCSLENMHRALKNIVAELKEAREKRNAK